LRAISALLVVDDVHRHRHLLLGKLNAIPEIAGRPSSRLDLARKTHARGSLCSHHGLQGLGASF